MDHGRGCGGLGRALRLDLKDSGRRADQDDDAGCEHHLRLRQERSLAGRGDGDMVARHDEPPPTQMDGRDVWTASAFPPINVPFIVEGARFKLNPRFIGLGPSPSDMFMAFDAKASTKLRDRFSTETQITAEKYPYDIMILLKTKCGAAPVLHEEGEFVMISPRGNVSHI